MSTIPEIIEQNNAAANFVVNEAGPIDNTTAELVLRSVAVAADRLNPDQVSQLGKPALDFLMGAAEVARKLTPGVEEDEQRLPHETEADFRHRVDVWQPLHRLQLAVSLGEYGDSPQKTDAVKRAIWLGSTAFENILTDPAADNFLELQRTVRYFGGNTGAAAGRAARLKERQAYETAQSQPTRHRPIETTRDVI